MLYCGDQTEAIMLYCGDQTEVIMLYSGDQTEVIMLYCGDHTEVITGRMQGSYFEEGHGLLRAFTVGKNPQIIRYRLSTLWTHVTILA